MLGKKIKEKLNADNYFNFHSFDVITGILEYFVFPSFGIISFKIYEDVFEERKIKAFFVDCTKEYSEQVKTGFRIKLFYKDKKFFANIELEYFKTLIEDEVYYPEVSF